MNQPGEKEPFLWEKHHDVLAKQLNQARRMFNNQRSILNVQWEF